MKTLFLLGLLTLIVSCAKEPTKVKAKLSFTTLTQSLVGMPNTYIMGIHTDSNHRFLTKVTSDEHETELVNGEWIFAAFSWDSQTAEMEGRLSCYTSGIHLINEVEIEIDINLSESECTKPIAPTSSLNLFHPASTSPFRFQNCIRQMSTTDISQLSPDFDCADEKISGKYISYKIVIPTFEFSSLEETHNNIVLNNVSSCRYIHKTQAGVPITNEIYHLPLIGDLPVHFLLYEDPACQVNEQKIHFNRGLLAPSLDGRAAFRISSSGIPNIFDFTTSCNGSALTNTPFAQGGVSTAPDPNFICTKEQFERIFDAAHYDQDMVFHIANNIDLTGFTHPSNAFSTSFKGKVEGHYYTLSNFDLKNSNNPHNGLFPRVDIANFEFKNMILKDFHVSMLDSPPPGPTYTAGLLIGTLDGTIAQTGVISNIRIDNSQTLGIPDIEFESGIAGALIGKVEIIGGSPLIAISEIHINDTYIKSNKTSFTTNTRAGGLIGEFDAKNTSTTPTHIIRNTFSTAKVEVPGETGGVIGRANGLILETSVFNGTILFNSYAGGLVGYLDNGYLRNNLVNMSFKVIGPTCTEAREIIGHFRTVDPVGTALINNFYQAINLDAPQGISQLHNCTSNDNEVPGVGFKEG